MKDKVRRCESEGKICYTEREAGEAVNNAKKHHKHHGPDQIPRRAYLCSCGCWHLTHIASCKTSRKKELFESKRRALQEFESEKLWREECCKFTAYRCNRW